MFFVPVRLNDNSCDINCLLNRMDSYIHKQTSKLLREIRFGIVSCIDEEALSDLEVYRDILITNLHGTTYGHSLQQIMSKINSIINR